MKRARILTALFIVIGSSQMAQAEDTLDIVMKADSLLIGTKIYSVSEMTVFRSDKARPTMKVETYSMAKSGTDHSLTVYKEPARMRGTAYLMIGDDLWVKFGSTGRTRKLRSSAKKNSAGGTDFSYADMGESSQGISYKYNVIMENSNVTVAGNTCYEISLHPKAGTEGFYEKLTAFITHDNYHYLRIDYYEDGANIKTLTFSDYRKIGQKEYPYRMVMVNHTKPSRTEVVTGAIEFDSSRVQDRFFTSSYLAGIK
ncbi:hypothetical protein ES705_15431 [subsurface metagenome]